MRIGEIAAVPVDAGDPAFLRHAQSHPDLSVREGRRGGGGGGEREDAAEAEFRIEDHHVRVAEEVKEAVRVPGEEVDGVIPALGRKLVEGQAVRDGQRGIVEGDFRKCADVRAVCVYCVEKEEPAVCEHPAIHPCAVRERNMRSVCRRSVPGEAEEDRQGAVRRFFGSDGEDRIGVGGGGGEEMDPGIRGAGQLDGGIDNLRLTLRGFGRNLRAASGERQKEEWQQEKEGGETFHGTAPRRIILSSFYHAGARKDCG